MESRTRLAISGTVTVVASFAVVCAVAMSTTSALADVTGAPVTGPAVVVVAASPTPASSATESAAPVAAPVAEPTTPPVVETETVEAPEPRDVTVPQSSPPTAKVSKADEKRIRAEARAARSWGGAYAWAKKHGWDRERIKAWIRQLEKRENREYPDKSWTKWNDDEHTQPSPTPTADETSEGNHSGESFGSKREQSRVPPD